MGNTAKDKGDRTEREGILALADYGLSAERILGAGRKDDQGDLLIKATTADPASAVAVQVKGYDKPYLASGIRQAALRAEEQRLNAIARGLYNPGLAVGIIPIPNVAKVGVKWLACTDMDKWPGGLPPEIEKPEHGGLPGFANVTPLITWLRDDKGPMGYRVWPRTLRIAAFGGVLKSRVLVAPLDAWVASYRQVFEQ